MIDFIPNERLYNLLTQNQSLVSDFKEKLNLIERFSVLLRTTNFNTIHLLDAFESLSQANESNFKASLEVIKLQADTILTAISTLENLLLFNPVYPVSCFFHIKGNLFLISSAVKVIKEIVENCNDLSLLKQKVNLLSKEIATTKGLCFDYLSYYEIIDFSLFNSRN